MKREHTKKPLRLNSAQNLVEPWAKHTQTALWVYAFFLIFCLLFAGLDVMSISGLAVHLSWHCLILLVNATAAGTEHIQDASFAVPLNIVATVHTAVLAVLYSSQLLACQMQACLNDIKTFAVLCGTLWVLAITAGALLVCSVMFWRAVRERNIEHLRTNRSGETTEQDVYAHELDHISAGLMQGQANAFHDVQLESARNGALATAPLATNS